MKINSRKRFPFYLFPKNIRWQVKKTPNKVLFICLLLKNNSDYNSSSSGT